tara:strand:+ start:4868 stop:5131 length:264 start_codon:yes stop_codon:yes gene_type:complete
MKSWTQFLEAKGICKKCGDKNCKCEPKGKKKCSTCGCGDPNDDHTHDDDDITEMFGKQQRNEICGACNAWFAFNARICPVCGTSRRF